jgi:two-component system sensor histidine kinase YesM
VESVVSGGLLHISFDRRDERLVIEIEDNGRGMSDREIWELGRKLSDPNSQLEITGLINVHKRLQLKFGETSGIAVSSGGKLGGLKVSLFIPVREEN